MRHTATLGAALVVWVWAWSGLSGQVREAIPLQQLHEEHRWFELRDAIVGRTVPPFFAGAVASAFNQTDVAERFLSRAVREAQTAEDANRAREVLANLYMRISRP